MKTKKYTITTLVPLGLSALVVALGSTLTAQQAGPPANQQAGDVSPEARLQEIRAEYGQINNELTEIQGKAMKDPEVKEKRESYHGALKEKMLEIAPDEVQPKVEKRFDLAEKLETVAAPQSVEEQQEIAKLNQDFQEIQQELSQIESEATQVAQVQEKRGEFLTVITEKMKAVDPNFDRLIDRQKELIEEFQSIQQQVGG